MNRTASTRIRCTLAAMLACAWLHAAGARAQAIPGAATGSQTGDGGGPYTGLASAPEADLFTGAARTSIPIQVPPGRLGLAPALSLVYSSSATASPYGYGWTLPLARIHRSLRGGAPRYDDSDTFVLAMPDASIDLEAVPGAVGAYRPRIESTFPRIGFDVTRNLWHLVDKSGVVFTFGSRRATRLGRGDGLAQTFAWLLETIQDPAGNTVEFSYRQDAASGLSSGLPDRIEYGGNRVQGTGALAEVRFTWQSAGYPSSPLVSLRAGWRETLDSRLVSIQTFARGLSARRYDFSHDVDPHTGDDRLVGVTLSGFAADPADDVRLPSTVFAYAPAVQSGWPTGASDDEDPAPLVVPDAGPLRVGRKTTTIDTLDVNGDAIVDYVDVRQSPPVVRLGTGSGLAQRRSWNWPAAPRYPDAPRWIRRLDGDGNLQSNLFDLDGDGFADLVDTDPQACAGPPEHWCVWRGSAEGLAPEATTWRAPGPRLRMTRKSGSRVVADLVDINADGYLDYVDSSAFADGVVDGRWNVFFNDGKRFAETASEIAAPLPYLARWNGARMLYGIFDLNADALPDLVQAEPGARDDETLWDQYRSWQVWFGNGSGFAPAASWPIESDNLKLPNFLSLLAEDGSVATDLLDVNGDGRPDLLRRNRMTDPFQTRIADVCSSRSHCPGVSGTESGVTAGSCCYNLLVFFNTGASFSAPVAWTAPAHAIRTSYESCPYSFAMCISGWLYDYDLFDFNGDGLVDLVVRAAPGDSPSTWRIFLHPATANAAAGSTLARPNLLVSMMNGIGGETLLGYRPASAAPDTRIPFPYWTVVRREVRDGVYDTPPRHAWISYRGGRYDALEREMRGFAMVWEVDDLGITRVREFHQDGVRKSRLRRLSVLGRPDCQAEDPSDPADPCSPWRLILSQHDYSWPGNSPVLLAAESEVPFGPGGAVEALRTTTAYAYDAYGNVARRDTATALAPSTTVESEFAARIGTAVGAEPGRYTVNKPLLIRVTQAGRTEPLLERRFEYDWQGPAFGALSRSMTCVRWEGTACASWSARTFAHDRFGNVTVARSATGEASTTTYDRDAVFAVEARDAAGLVTTSEVDPRTGNVLATVDPLGNRLSSEFDGLGRLLRTWGPGTSRQSPLAEHRYAPGALGAGPPRIVTRRAGAAPSATFFDGLGRVAATKTLKEVGGQTVAVVSGLQLYGADGSVARAALPQPVADLDVGSLGVSFDDAEAWIEILYDRQGRPAETIYPDGSRTRVDRSAPGISVAYDANISSTGPPPTPAGAVTIELFDGFGRRLQRDVCSTRPLPALPYDCPDGSLERRESWFYDGLGRVVTRRVHGLGRAAGDSLTHIEYDGLGKRTSVDGGDTGSWRFEYDATGRPTASVEPDGTRVRSTYDRAGRLLRQRGPRTAASYRYWGGGAGLGKVRRITSRTHAERVLRSFDYDTRGRVVAETWRVLVRGHPSGSWTARYRYDELDRRVAVEYPGVDAAGGELVETGFNAFGDAVSLASSRATYVAAAAYDLYGRLARIDYGNGLSDRFEYDPWSNARATKGRLRCLRTTRSDSPAGACDARDDDLAALWYRSYDANGNLLEVADLLHSPAELLHDGRRYAYDALGRLAEATYGDGASERFAFDPLGNLLAQGERRLAYTDAERPTRLSSVRREGTAESVGVAFDANGSRIANGDVEYAYDDLLRLRATSASDGPRTAYGYDGSGRRAYRYDAVADSLRLEFGDLVAVEGDEIERSFYLGERLVAVDRLRADLPRRGTAATPRRLFLHPDHQGTPRLVSDDGGNAVEHARFGAFGQRRATFDASGRPLSASASERGFTGHLEDRAAALLFAGARYYDPDTGAFLTLDPAFQFSSPYAYSDGNPVSGHDPDGAFFGLTALEVVMALAGSAALVDSLVRTGDLGHSLTAGVAAGFSVYASHQLSATLARPLVPVAPTWMLQAASIASEGFQVRQALRAIDNGEAAAGVVSIGLLAGSLVGIESANDPGPGAGDEQRYASNGIADRGTEGGTRVIEVSGICATRPGCVTNFFTALRENLSVLLGNRASCVNGCAEVQQLTREAIEKGESVRLLCNSFGAIKCVRALQELDAASRLDASLAGGLARVEAQISGAPLLRPPSLKGVTYQVNLFDPVVWVGTLYSVPLRSDVVLGPNWWLPLPLVMHHSRTYEKPAAELLADFLH